MRHFLQLFSRHENFTKQNQWNQIKFARSHAHLFFHQTKFYMLLLQSIMCFLPYLHFSIWHTSEAEPMECCYAPTNFSKFYSNCLVGSSIPAKISIFAMNCVNLCTRNIKRRKNAKQNDKETKEKKNHN